MAALCARLPSASRTLTCLLRNSTVGAGSRSYQGQALETPPASAPAGDAHVVDSALVQLERMAEQRVDPEKLRWQRMLAELLRSRAGFAGPSVLRAVAAVADHPVALAAPSAAPLLDRAVGSFALSLESVPAQDLVPLLWALTQARLLTDEDALADEDGEDGGAAKSIEEDEDFLLPASGATPRPHAARLAAAAASPERGADKPRRGAAPGVHARGAAARSLLWGTLAPRALRGAHELAPDARAKLLLSLALAWRTSPGDASESLLPALADAVALALEGLAADGTAGPESRTVAHLVGALGLLQLQGALPPSAAGADAASRVARTVEVDLVGKHGLPGLVLLSVGLRGLGLEDSRLSRDVAATLQARLRGAGASGPERGEVCEALLLLRSCGRLRLREPWAFALLRQAANDVDGLARGERKALQGLLTHLARDLDCGRTGAPAAGEVAAGAKAEATPYPAGSPEAATCWLVRHSWFARKSRLETSWWKNRGQIHP